MHDKYLFKPIQEDKELEKETFEVTINGVHTTVDAFFNAQGYCVGTSYDSVDLVVPSDKESRLNDLENELKWDIEHEDYKHAELISKQIQQLKLMF